MSRLILLSTLFLLLAACGSKSPSTESGQAQAVAPVAKLDIPNDTMLEIKLPADASQSYMIYRPASAYTTEMPMSVIVFFDPHGAGAVPVEKYRKLADRFGIILVGSNNSRNGQPIAESEQIANNIITDLSMRGVCDSAHICLAGFSGGSKVALQTGANNKNISNIIYLGAATPITPNHPTHLLGFAGTEDMNYSDLLEFGSILAKGSYDASLIEFRGKHEWPDTTTFKKAFYWLTFPGYRAKGVSKDPTNAIEFKAEADRNIAAAEKKGALIEAYQECATVVSFLNGVSDATPYQAKMTTISGTEAYKAQSKQKSDILQKEASDKKTLLAAFQSQDGAWWYKTIKNYKASTSPSDKRLLGFISLACYSYTGQLLTRQDTANAAHILSIYEEADPDNTDQLYFHAILYSQENNADQAIKYLYKAADKGFKDWQRIETDPAFTQLRGYESFSRLVTSLKKGSK